MHMLDARAIHMHTFMSCALICVPRPLLLNTSFPEDMMLRTEE